MPCDYWETVLHSTSRWDYLCSLVCPVLPAHCYTFAIVFLRKVNCLYQYLVSVILGTVIPTPPYISEKYLFVCFFVVLKEGVESLVFLEIHLRVAEMYTLEILLLFVRLHSNTQMPLLATTSTTENTRSKHHSQALCTLCDYFTHCIHVVKVLVISIYTKQAFNISVCVSFAFMFQVLNQEDFSH